jgi:polyisoprenyl-phosphate glycosyltransferase
VEVPLRYSVVVPVYNDQEVLPELHRQLSGLLGRLDGDAEVVLVDDGSRDNSLAMMLEMHRRDERFKVVELSRNFGHQVAITAGMDVAQGDAVVVMDADLQDPPDVVLEMVARWREGYDIVYGVRRKRNGESWLKRRTASLFYRLLHRLTDADIPLDAADFRLIDRRAIETFKSMRESNRYVRGMFAWMGFKQIGVPYDRSPRLAGSTHYPFKKMLKLATDGVVGFSLVPLRAALKIGAVVAALSFLGGAVAIASKLLGIFTVPGWASVTVAVSFIGGFQLMVLGVMGEYIGRIYSEVVNRPLYVISDLHGIDGTHLNLARTVLAPGKEIVLDPPPVRRVSARR